MAYKHLINCPTCGAETEHSMSLIFGDSMDVTYICKVDGHKTAGTVATGRKEWEPTAHAAHAYRY